LIFEGQKVIYSALGCNSAQWEQNEQTLLEKGAGQYMMMAQGGLRERVK
jgi:hypothetical protein